MADDKEKDDEYISGEQHAALHAHKKSGATFTITKPMAILIAAVILAGLSFYAGIQYQKGRQPATSTTTAGSAGASGTTFGQGSGRRFSGQRPTFGSVTAISPTSITVDSNAGTNVTFAITSSTSITDNGQTTTTSDITVDEQVVVFASTNQATQAARILVNPNFGGNAPTSTPDNSATPTVTN